MRLLTVVPKSVLWLRHCNKWSVRKLCEEASKRGVEPTRIIFAKSNIPMAMHLERHRLADLFLDTFNYNAHSTAVDALWAGLPIITKSGDGFAARVATSLLTALEMSELIVTTEQAYEALALDLATNPDRIAGIKQTLSKNLSSTPLFDSEQFTKHLESGYEQAYQRYLDGKDPAGIQVSQ